MKTAGYGILGFLICSVWATSVQAALIINVNYTGDPQYAAAFTTAAGIWQNLLVGYQDGVVANHTAGSSYTIGQTVTNVFITANVNLIDGVGGILGQAGPEELALDSAGFLLTTDGAMEFDSADVANLVANNQWEPVILHEMAHVLGFGTLWNDNGVYVNGTGEFTGANATAAWQSEFNQLGTPDVELGGGPGTANGHWNEVNNGAGPTGIVDSLARDMRDELMTGWLNPNYFISDMTVASFRDIGFTATAVPEPCSTWLAGMAVGFVGLKRWRKKRQLLA